MGFLKSIGLGSSKSRPASSSSSVRVASIVKADLEENESGVSVSVATGSTTDRQRDENRGGRDVEAMKADIKEKQASVIALADGACDRLAEIVDSQDPDWVVWEDKKSLLIDKHSKCLSGGICGRARYSWMAPEDAPYSFDFVAEFIWDDKTKPLYDEFTQEMLVLIEYEDDYHVLNQTFHGRFGISGRDFMIAIHKRRCDTDTHERMIMGATSVPKEDEEIIDNIIIDEEIRNKHFLAKERLVRGFVYTAGFCLSRSKESGEFTVTYVHDADVKTQGVPQWIVNRVKLDQLRIVKDIPHLLRETYLNR